MTKTRQLIRKIVDLCCVVSATISGENEKYFKHLDCQAVIAPRELEVRIIVRIPALYYFLPLIQQQVAIDRIDGLWSRVRFVMQEQGLWRPDDAQAFFTQTQAKINVLVDGEEMFVETADLLEG